MSNTRTALLAAARPARRSVPICVDGSLHEQARRAEAALASARLAGSDISTAEADLARVHEEMVAATFTFTFEAMADKAWADLLVTHPPREGKHEAFNAESFPAALHASCCVEPDGFDTIETAQELLDALPNQGERSKLFDAAFEVNVGSADLPKSVTESVARRGSKPSSATRSRSVSLAASSSVAS